jgi:uncharacterized protein (TIGR03435 family)
MNKVLRTEKCVLRKFFLNIIGIIVLALPAVSGLAYVVHVHAQSQMDRKALPGLEIATIKSSKPDQPLKGAQVQGNRLRAINITLNDLIAGSYGVSPRQVIGIPSWGVTDKFDIEIKPEGEGAPSVKQCQGMLQKLILDRFKLSFHREKKELPVYILSVAKAGPKVTRSLNPNSLPGSRSSRLGNMHNTNMTMDFFAQWMQLVVLDRPVVDRTGLEGKFDFDLNWTPDDSQFAGWRAYIPPPVDGAKTPDDSQFAGWRAYIPPPVDGANAPPPLYTAIQAQIGLQLDSTRMPIVVLVIDHVEKPYEN